MYTVVASDVVTLAFVATRIGLRTVIALYCAAIPENVVFVSLNVPVETVSIFPLIPGVPDLAPGDNVKAVVADDDIVVTPAKSIVKVKPPNETAFVSGNARSVPLP